MNRDTVMHLANQSAGQHWMDEAHIQRFAALVAAHERKACAAIVEVEAMHERDACAKVCEAFQARDVGMQPAECAGAIRARSNHD